MLKGELEMIKFTSSKVAIGFTKVLDRIHLDFSHLVLISISSNSQILIFNIVKKG
jgi:uroporphyrinogen-III synthase